MLYISYLQQKKMVKEAFCFRSCHCPPARPHRAAIVGQITALTHEFIIDCICASTFCFRTLLKCSSRSYIRVLHVYHMTAVPSLCYISLPMHSCQALVRLSESLAKMRLSAEVSAQDVQEALRLFKVSTMAAASAGSTAGDLGSLRPETQQEVRRAEDFLKRRIAVRSTVNRKKVCGATFAYRRG